MRLLSPVLLLVGILFVSATSRFKSAEAGASSRPNIVFILADDLGYGELGVYGQQLIETPHLDALAKSGMQFSQFYSGSAVCAPARSVLLTGQHTGHTYIRGNDEWADRGDVWNFEKAAQDPNLEGQRPLPAGTQTIGSVLQNAGYATACVGKWGLGAPRSEGRPNLMGFDFFYGYNCQRQAHNLYPPHQWRNTEKIPLNNPLFAPNARLAPEEDAAAPVTYARFAGADYAPSLQLQEALDFLDKTAGKQPFFLLYTSPLPHVALQAPTEKVAYYEKKFGPEKPYGGAQGYLPTRSPRATYAAMIHTLDEQVGAIVAKLRARGVDKNTLILFTSDNGPSYAGGVDPEFFQSAGPFQGGYGRGKGFLYEGGIRVPFIAAWPEKIKPGSQSNHVAALWDIFPTLLELARASATTPIDGLSLIPVFSGKKQAPGHPFLYWEFPEYGGQQAVRMGKWKALRLDMQNGKSETMLFNLETDLQEKNNVAAQFPEIVAEMERIMIQEHDPSPITRFQIKAIDASTSKE